MNGVHRTTTIPKSGVEPKKDYLHSSQNLNWLLYLFYGRRNFGYCKLIIEECLTRNFDQEYPYYVRGLIAREEGELPEAIKHFQKSLEFNSKNADCCREIGKTLWLMGRQRQSLEIFVKTEALLQRADCELYYYIGKLLSKNVSHGKLANGDAKDYFMKAIQGGKHCQSMVDLAEIHIKEGGGLRKAIELLEASLQVNTDDMNTITRVGILHLMIGDTQIAFTKLLDALAIDDRNPKILLALGGILQARGDTDGALNKYNSIQDLETQGGSELWNNLGLCFFKNQKIIAAISAISKSVWISPLNFNALFNMGYVFVKAKLFVSALHVFTVTVNLKPNHAECYMLIGVCLTGLGDKKNAAVAFEKAAMLPEAIKNPLIYLNFSIFCYQNHDYEQSYTQLRNFMGVVESVRALNIKEHLKIARKLMGLLNSIIKPLDTAPVVRGGRGITTNPNDINPDESNSKLDGVGEGREEELAPKPQILTSVDDDLDSAYSTRTTGGEAEGKSSPPTPPTPPLTEPSYDFVTVIADVERGKPNSEDTEQI